LSYFDDESNDFSKDGIFEFLEPILESEEINSSEIEELCSELTTLNTADVKEEVVLLKESVQMDSFTDTVKLGVKNHDIRHGSTNRGPAKTTVDLRKLRNVERKIEEKRKARGQYDGEVVPEWDPTLIPSMVVNQTKASVNTKSKDVKFDDFDIQFAGRSILKNASITLVYGRKYGLVGMNGIGKSTLLRAIANGELTVPSHIKVAHVEQEISGTETSAIESVMKADLEREALIEEEKRINLKLNRAATTLEEGEKLGVRLKQVYARLEEIEADKAESRASAILNGLGFSSVQQSAATNTFSGGWRMRLSLAQVLFARPDLLLADEVTNYLDFPAVVWLEKYFQNWKGTLLVVSHDKSFLDSFTTDILHLHNYTIDPYRGSFSVFVGTRGERRRNLIREYESQLQYRQHLQDFIDRWRYNAKRAAQAQSKMKILEKLPPLVEPSKDDMAGMGQGQESIYFKFPDPEKLSPPILRLDGVSFGYDKSKIILQNVSFDLQMDSKIAICGPNGAGNL
jgi:ATP-binding cassette subfamily F protein 3